MAVDKKNIFRQESLDRIESPEKLDQYIKVSKPSVWILLAALFIIALGAGIWAFTGALPQNVTVRGVTLGEDQVSLYVPAKEYSKDLEGDPVVIRLPDHTDVQGVVESVEDVPLSRVDLAEQVGEEWIVEELNTDLYSYRLNVRTQENIPAGWVVSASLTTAEVKPIEYLLN